jgi:hypothetical protein
MSPGRTSDTEAVGRLTDIVRPGDPMWRLWTLR